MASQSSSDKTALRVPVLRRGHARVAGLLRVAAAVFAEKGVEAATMTEIAAQAGASIGSLYQFFPTKAVLAGALHAHLLVELGAVLDDLRAQAGQHSPAGIADLLFTRLLAFLQANPAFSALADRRDVDPVRKAETRAQMRGQIAGLLVGASPAMEPGRAEVMAVVILQLMKAAVALAQTDDAAMREAAVGEMRGMLVRWLGEDLR